MKAILLLDPWSKPGMTALEKAVCESCKTRYLHSINYTDCNAGDATMSQFHVIPGLDQGPYARDKN